MAPTAAAKRRKFADPRFEEAGELLTAANIVFSKVWDVDFVYGIPHRIFYTSGTRPPRAKFVIIRVDDGQVPVVLKWGDGWPA